ncbi:unnamed protein product [Symbiodinium sp. CCMP2592]|nr:unnamed protein product [Symbiodinium sp. CCMP2592]
MESLPYSPTTIPGGRDAAAFYSEAWPAQPEAVRPGPGDQRHVGEAPAASMDAKVGRFLPTACCDGDLYDDDKAAVCDAIGHWSWVYGAAAGSACFAACESTPGVVGRRNGLGGTYDGAKSTAVWTASEKGDGSLECSSTVASWFVDKFKKLFGRIRHQPNRMLAPMWMRSFRQLVGILRVMVLRVYQEMLGLSSQVMEYLEVIGLIWFRVYPEMLGLSLQVMEYLGAIGLILLRSYP